MVRKTGNGEDLEKNALESLLLMMLGLQAK